MESFVKQYGGKKETSWDPQKHHGMTREQVKNKMENHDAMVNASESPSEEQDNHFNESHHMYTHLKNPNDDVHDPESHYIRQWLEQNEPKEHAPDTLEEEDLEDMPWWTDEESAKYLRSPNVESFGKQYGEKDEEESENLPWMPAERKF